MDDSKIKIGLILVSLVILIGGVFILSGKSNIDKKILVRDFSHQTNPQAPVTLVEFSDFQCPACITYHPIVKQLTDEYKNELNFVYRHFPLTQHKNAVPAAMAAEASAKQGKYYQMYDLLFSGHTDWENETNPDPVFEKYAKDLSLDIEKFKIDVKSDEVKKHVTNDYNDGLKVRIDSTPTFFINGEKIANAGSADDFKKIIDEAIKNNPLPSISAASSYHAHFNIKTVINGKAVDFSQSKFQKKDGKELDENIHFHDGVGDVVHVHKEGMVLNDLFISVGFAIDEKCLSTDLKDKYCSDDKGNLLQMYVNGEKNNLFGRYEPKDLDRVLITYGNEKETKITEEIKSVADTACIYSGKCPDRGKPPAEECAGGAGTTCE